MSIIERNAVSKNFSNAADTYDFWAKPQKKIARRLVELLPALRNYIPKILDVSNITEKD